MVSVIDITTSSMRVTWSSHGSNVAHYNIELYYGPTQWGDPVPGKQIYGISPSVRGYNFLNLEPGRQYYVKLYSKDSNQNTIKIENTTFYTLETSYPFPSTPTLYVSVSGRSLNIYGTIYSNTTYLNVYINGSRQWRIYVGSSSSYDLDYTGSYSTRYEVKVVPENSWHTGTEITRTVYTDAEPLPDPPPAPSGFNIYNQGETWASFAWNAAARAEKYAMEIFQGNSIVKYDYNIFDRVKTFTGLSPGITYLAKLYGWNEGGNGTPVTFYFSLGYSRPRDFSWSVTKANGFSYTLDNGVYRGLVTYDEFIAFRQAINDFRRYEGLSTYTFTNIARGTYLSATLYNQLNTAINAMSPPTSTPGSRSSGASGLAGLLNGLRNSLNSIR